MRPALGLLLSIAVAPAAEAGRVSLVPTTPTSDLMAGETVSFDVMMDFTTDDSGLGSDATLGGGFDIDFDPTALRFDGLADAGLGDPGFGRDPDILSGLLESWGFASFNGLTGPALVGSVSFIVLERRTRDELCVDEGHVRTCGSVRQRVGFPDADRRSIQLGGRDGAGGGGRPGGARRGGGFPLGPIGVRGLSRGERSLGAPNVGITRQGSHLRVVAFLEA